jgi:endonuclease/exonuclease/phosphatase family metal-dependent hydrolase
VRPALLVTLAIVTGCGSGSGATPDGGAGDGGTDAGDGGGRVVVMTRNIYLGADLGPLTSATSVQEALAAIPGVIDKVKATDLPERAQALAAEITAAAPELVGLQEVVVFTLDGSTGDPPCRDDLADLLAALAGHGAHYMAAATVQHLQLAVPVPGIGTVGVEDRDVILARDDVVATPVPLDASVCPAGRRSQDGCNYAAAAALAAVGATIPRGFVMVDATVPGFGAVRLVSTHLEIPDFGPSVPSRQAAELIAAIPQVPNPANLPLVVVGDMSSSPSDQTTTVGGVAYVPPYAQLAAVSHDTWPLARAADPGSTCCQRDDLLNPTSSLTRRIDLVLTDWVRATVTATLVGDQPSDRTTPTGLWPSDHAGVAAGLAAPAHP